MSNIFVLHKLERKFKTIYWINYKLYSNLVIPLKMRSPCLVFLVNCKMILKHEQTYSKLINFLHIHLHIHIHFTFTYTYTYTYTYIYNNLIIYVNNLY